MLDHTSQSTLKKLAKDSIQFGLHHGKPLHPDLSHLVSELTEHGASFVTLKLNNMLRGCIGSLEAYRPLATDVADNAFAAAFRDHRFPPLNEEEFARVDIQLSVLTPPSLIPCQSEADLIAQLRPNIDGLIIDDRGHRATFLPSVWEQLPSADQFIRNLKLKAGLPVNYWSDSLKCYRYQSDYF